MEHPLVSRSVARLEPFQMYQSPPRSSVSLNQMLIRSFIRSSVRPSVRLPARSLRKSPFRKRTKLSQRRRGEKRKGGSVRIGKEKKERECERYWHSVARSLARCHSKESDNITYERANDGQFSIFKLLRRTCVDFVIALCHANEPTTFRRILFH